MAESIDELQIKINAEATKANDAIDRLVGKLDRLTTSLSKINGTNLNGLANGVQRLGTAMQTMNNVSTADFTRLASNLTRLGLVNVSALNSAANSMSNLTRAFNSLGTVSANAQAVGEMAKNIAKLGNKSVQTAIANIPQLATAMNSLMTTLSRSPQVSKNVIQLTNALANFASQGARVGTASNSIVNGLTRTMTFSKKAGGGFKGLSYYIGRFYQTMFMVIRGIKKLWQAIKSTADYIEAYNYFNVSLGKIGADWSYQYEKYGYDNAESYAESFNTRLTESLKKLSGVQISVGADGKGLLTETGMKNLGLNIQEITQYAAQLASVTNSVGQTGETSLAIASSFAKLAGDISSLFNVDYSSVAKNLQSGLIGQSRALYKYGIDITNATLQTKAYELGLSKAVSEMTQAEKMQLRMLAILDQSKVSWGDLANTINSPSNMLRQFKTNLKETGMILGQLFIPILEKVMPVINGVTIAIKRLLVNIAGLLGVKIDLDKFGQGYTEIEDSIDDLTGSYEDATAAAKKFKSTTLGIDELNINSPQEDTGNEAGGVSGEIDLTDEILKATEKYENAWNQAYEQMENKANKFADKMEQALEPIKNIFKNFIEGDFFEAGQDVSNLVAGISGFFTEAIGNVDWYGIGEKIGNFLSGIDWGEILSSIGKRIWEAINSGIELWKGAFDAAPIETTIITGISALSFTGLGEVILFKLGAGLFKGIKGAILFPFQNPMAFAGMFMGTPAFDVIGSEILDVISEVIKNLIPDWAFDALSSMGAGMVTGALAGSWFPGVGTVAGAIIGTILGAFAGIKIDGKSPLQHIVDTIFNFDETKLIFEDVKKNFEKGGLNIVLGIGEGIVGALGFLVEPIKDLFEAIWNGICKLFGIHSPATKMNPIGENIVLGIKEGFVGAFSKLEEATKKLWNSFANWFNDLLTFEIEPISLFGKQVFEGATIKLGNLPTFGEKASVVSTPPSRLPETLNKPESSRFMYSNNEVFSDLLSNLNEMKQKTELSNDNLMREQNELLKAILEKDTSVVIGDRDIARANARGSRLIGNFIVT